MVSSLFRFLRDDYLRDFGSRFDATVGSLTHFAMSVFLTSLGGLRWDCEVRVPRWGSHGYLAVGSTADEVNGDTAPACPAALRLPQALTALPVERRPTTLAQPLSRPAGLAGPRRRCEVLLERGHRRQAIGATQSGGPASGALGAGATDSSSVSNRCAPPLLRACRRPLGPATMRGDEGTSY